ncbi:porin [Tautonia marina]|uniref:porin n=1 Tax=Tautonia marina TaxID=2653855 RepID=UPI001376247B|nr:porin [Tautonia marina]
MWERSALLCLLMLGLPGLTLAGAQDDGSVSDPEPASPSPLSLPPLDPSITPSDPAPPADPIDRLEAIEARLRALEDQNRQLTEENQELRRLIAIPPPAPPDPNPTAPPAPGAGSRSLTEAFGSTPPPASTSTSVPRGSGTALGNPPNTPVPGITAVSPGRAEERVPILGRFGQGFQFESENKEFLLQINLESQTDYRAFDPSGDGLARDGFYQPRNRILFGGRVTRPVEYLFSINRGFSGLNLLDSFINVHADDRLMFKVGRFQSPQNYEQFAVSNLWLIAPERSLFTSNLGLNRQVGAMFWGELFDERLDYALALVNGPRNSYEDYNNDKDLMTYFNLRPFQDQPRGTLLRLLNLGGSFVYGTQDNPLVPDSFRVATNASNADTADRAAPPFLIFNPGVIERGQRAFWSAHMAYFYRSLSLLADYNGAILRYAPSRTAPNSAVLPAHGFSIAAGYFLTGEELERRSLVEPLRPFSLKRGSFGPGAIELFGRYSTLDFSSNIFTAGLADPNLWSNSAAVTNLGVNWYPNRFTKVLLTWQYASFGSPVLYALPDQKMIDNNMLWLRFQLYY